MAQTGFTARFWGVRNHIAMPGPETVGYGGNTPCLEVRCGDTLLIFDSGTGIRPLGNRLVGDGPVDGDLFFSHVRLDHISGLPFFTAAFVPGNAFRLWASSGDGTGSIESELRRLMIDPIFPVPLDVMRAKLDFRDFAPGDVLEPGPGVKVRTARLNARSPVTGFRVEYAGRSLAYAIDVGPAVGTDERALESFIAGADLAVLGTDVAAGAAEPDWRWVLACCARARVRKVTLTNHAQTQDDATLDRLGLVLAAEFPAAALAREGWRIEV